MEKKMSLKELAANIVGGTLVLLMILGIVAALMQPTYEERETVLAANCQSVGGGFLSDGKIVCRVQFVSGDHGTILEMVMSGDEVHRSCTKSNNVCGNWEL